MVLEQSGVVASVINDKNYKLITFYNNKAFKICDKSNEFAVRMAMINNLTIKKIGKGHIQGSPY